MPATAATGIRWISGDIARGDSTRVTCENLKSSIPDRLVVLIVRSVIFNTLFYLNLLAHIAVALPTFFMNRHAIMAVAKSWSRSSQWLLRVICDVKVEWRGLEKIPAGGLIVASKHQSAWETFALVPVFADFAFIVKRELMWLPFFGWYMAKAGMIPVDRGKGAEALAAMTARARAEIARGRQIIIFPEGTRRPAGAEPRYKFGVSRLYAETGAPCLPIALNSGLFWPRRSFLRFPGTIRVEILDPIPPGLEPQDFFVRLQEVVERATARLLEQGEREVAPAAVTLAHSPDKAERASR
jgi:1-acyl-sn-glycerol-3-phosphate acyltransferase